MPKSRRRKPRKTSKQRTDRSRPKPSGWGEFEPWARAMMLADEAEARGDANGALEVMEAFALGPDGKPFWRPWRIEYLCQIESLASILPPWVTSRWICNQAMQCLHEGNRDRKRRAFDLAVELRGGRAHLPGIDEADVHGRVVDRDWAYRQLFLYELGGLDFFVRRVASSLLLAGADSMSEWSRAQMGGYQLVDEGTATTTWRDLGSGEPQSCADIGSGVFVAPGEHVLGRLVPTQRGPMFESRPLLVPETVAHAVAERPADWVDLLRTSRTAAGVEPIVLDGPHRDSLVSDVPPYAWQLALLGPAALRADPCDEGFASTLARAVLDVAAHEIECERDRRPEEVNIWPCLGAALLEPYVVEGLPDALTSSDQQLLRQVSRLVAEPAATLCREAAEELFNAA